MKYPNMTWGTMEAIVNKLGGEEKAKAFLRGAAEVAWTKLLEAIGAVKVTVEEKFVAKEKFREDSKEVKFYGIWSNFTKWFLSSEGTIEEPVGDQELRYGKLIKGSVDGPIIEELGGEAKAETTLSEMYTLLKEQSNGEDGVLLTNGYANIFYVHDTSGVLRAVNVIWFVGGWRVSAYSVVHPLDWNAGFQVFSRNS